MPQNFDRLKKLEKGFIIVLRKNIFNFFLLFALIKIFLILFMMNSKF